MQSGACQVSPCVFNDQVRVRRPAPDGLYEGCIIDRPVVQTIVLIMDAVIVVQVIGADLRRQVLDQPVQVPAVGIGVAEVDQDIKLLPPAQVRKFTCSIRCTLGCPYGRRG